jgi:GxxExxY protein
MRDADRDDRDTGLVCGDLTEAVIGAFYAVYNDLGPGFLESVYENALLLALAEAGIPAEAQVPLTVRFRNQIVGQFRADVLVAGQLIVEIKAVSHVMRIHEVQLVNYLRATDIPVGLLLNFSPRAEIRRRVFTTIV